MQIYLVGGAVRDNLLGNPVHERDWVVVGATPQEMLDLGYRPVGKDFPVFLHPKTHEEYALARIERSTGRGYTQFVCDASPHVTLEEDLLRRDLTINAMAQTPDGKIIDPFGGQQDLKNKLLRHVSPAFSEDPVRILRVGRFAARYNFDIASETGHLMRDMVRAGEVNALVPERVWQELVRALGEPQPQRFFEVLRESGALAILFPEIDELFGVPNPPKWHPEIDTGIHTLMVLTQAARLSPEPIVRFAALLHDLGKGKTPMTAWPSHHGHEELGIPLVKAMVARYRIPRDFAELALLASRYHGHCHQAFELKSSTIVKLLEHVDAFRRPARFEQLLLACEADSRGRPGSENQPYPQTQYLLRMQHIAAQVPIQPLLDRGLQDSALGDALHQARVNAIKQLIHDKKHTNHMIVCHKENIQYDVVFSARRTFAIEVHTNLQVVVRVPKKVSLAEVDKKVEQRLDWIRKKLEYFRKHPTHIPSRHYTEGEPHLYLGKHYPLRITAGHLHSVQLLRGNFEIACEKPVTPQKIKILMNTWYLEHSKIIFDTLLKESFPYFARLGFELPHLRIRHMKTRWGSLSSRGVVTLNSDLVRASMVCIEYVVFHELCHLKHRGHGKRFYSLLEKVLPDWRERRELLRQIIP